MKNYAKLKYLDHLLQQKASGISVPFLDNMPVLNPDNLWIMKGYEVLSSQRLTIEGQPQPIQVSEIVAYINFFGAADEADREDFMWIILKMDSLALEYAHRMAKKHAQEAKRRAASSSSRSKRR